VGQQFDTTAWSVVTAAQGERSGVAKAALEVLCARYWPPLYTYVRLKGYACEDAEDLTQEFFARLLSHDFLQNVEPSRGRFRTFLLACMDHFLRDEWQKNTRLKRGGHTNTIGIDFASGEKQLAMQSQLGVAPKEAFDRQWAESLLDAVYARLESEYAAGSKGAVFASLSCYLVGDGGGQSYGDAANELGLTKGAVKVAVHRMRKRFAELAREEIAETVETEGEIDEELSYLIRVLST